MFKCSNVRIFKCSNIQIFKYSNAQMIKCQMSNVNEVKLLSEITWHIATFMAFIKLKIHCDSNKFVDVLINHTAALLSISKWFTRRWANCWMLSLIATAAVRTNCWISIEQIFIGQITECELDLLPVALSTASHPRYSSDQMKASEMLVAPRISECFGLL